MFGFDADPSKRHIVALAGENPQLAKDGIALRKWGQQIIERLGGKRIHPGGVIPGGVADPLTEEVRDHILAGVPEALVQVERTHRVVQVQDDGLGGGSLALRQLPVCLHVPRR